MRYQWLGAFALFAILSAGAWADTLTLRDGSQLHGRFVSGGNGSVSFMPDGGRTRRFDMNQIGSISFGSSGYTGADRAANADRSNDYFATDQHQRYDQYRDRPDYRNSQPEGGAIENKYRDMTRVGLNLGAPVSGEQTAADGQGRFREYQNGTVYWSPRTGVHEVHGGIRNEYMKQGAERGRLGYPTSDEMPDRNGSRVSHFEGGSIYWDQQTGAHVEYNR